MGLQASRGDLTTLLGRRTGTPDDRERLFEAVQGELRRTAGAYMKLSPVTIRREIAAKF